MLFWAAGEAAWFGVLAKQSAPSYPSLSDALWLTYYGLSLAAVLTMIRSGLSRVGRSLWIDALVGGLAVAAIAAGLLVGPIVESTGGSVAATATSLAYPLVDVLILGLLIGVFVMTGGRPGRIWALLGTIWACQTVLDTIYSSQASAGGYVFGTLLDAGWPAVMLLVALAAWHRPRVVETSSDQSWAMLAVTIAFALVGLFLTGFDKFVHPLNEVAVILGMLTLVAAFVRTTMTFAELRTHAHGMSLATQNRLILAAAGEGIVGMDAAGAITFMNPAGARMTGYAADDLAGRDLHATLHHTRADGTPFPARECPIQASLLDGTIHHSAADVFWRSDGSRFAAEYTSTPIVAGDRIGGAVIVFRDITERREIERAKDEFTAIVSHELRTPLTSIRGSLGLLESGVLGPLPDRGRRMIQIAVQNTDRLVRLINDILDLERLDSDAMHLRETTCDAAQLVSRATEAMLPTAIAAGVTLVVDAAPATFEADEDRLIQTLTNLLGNAVKFSPRGGTVRIGAERQCDQILFCVTDDGPGIACDKLESIFGRFQQIDSTDSRQTGGTGLGLAISRAIVEHHGGRLWAESVPGAGSTFSFVVPAALVVAEDYTPRSGGDRGSVLICDDNAEILEVTGRALDEQGYRVMLARSGEEAIERALVELPDAILMDLQLPGMSGEETVAALREHQEADGIPVVVLSVLPRSEEAVRRSAFTDWIQKPAPPAELFAALERAIGARDDRFRVLCVQRDPAAGALLRALLARHGVVGFTAARARDAIALCERVRPDLILVADDVSAVDEAAIDDWVVQAGREVALSVISYDAGDFADAEDERRAVGAVSQILTKGQTSAEEFQWRLVTLLARPRARRAPIGGRS